jgi:hypothetical protein
MVEAGHTVYLGAEIIVRMAMLGPDGPDGPDGPTGEFMDRHGVVPW